MGTDRKSVGPLLYVRHECLKTKHLDFVTRYSVTVLKTKTGTRPQWLWKLLCLYVLLLVDARDVA